MKKKTDKIDQLLNAYKKASSVRIASEKRKIARLEAKEKAREKFIADARDKIIFTVRPVMKNLLNRLSKKDFLVSITNDNDQNLFTENYYVDGKVEKELGLYFTFQVHELQNRIEFIRIYEFTVDEINNTKITKLYHLNEINEQLINKLFIEGLQKICL